MQSGMRVLIAGLVLVSAAGCHAGQTSAAGDPDPNAGIFVNVTNNYATSMDVYVLSSGTVERLGVVGPGTNRRFEVPAAIVSASGGTLQFRAQPTGYGPIVDTDPIVLHGGHLVDFEIATNLIGSHANIR